MRSQLSDIDNAIKEVSTVRADFGAVQNRLEHRLNNLATYQENLTASESRIRDVDMAAEMTKFTKLNILQQAGTSMLAQANQAPQNVLSLLRQRLERSFLPTGGLAGRPSAFRSCARSKDFAVLPERPITWVEATRSRLGKPFQPDHTRSDRSWAFVFRTTLRRSTPTVS